MYLNQWKTGLFTGLCLATSFAVAQSPLHHEQLQVPQCLASKITSAHKTLAQNADFKIIDIASNEIDELAKLAEKVRCGHFVNVTHQLQSEKGFAAQTPQQLLNKSSIKTLKTKGDTYELSHPDDVNAALGKVEPNNIWQTLTSLTSFYNRSSTTDNGVEAAEWLKAEFDKMAKTYDRQDTNSYFVKTGAYYKQPSLVTVIGKDIDAPAVVIGAHMDTLSGRMPGAGDDGSGSSSAMEAARVLLASKELKRPVYVIWYAAEERGLVGSQYVVRDFLKKSIPVRAAIQLDMTGYRNDMNDRTIWVYRDYTDNDLNHFVTELIKTYVQVPVDFSKCGYGCSDHASWMEKGIPASFPCETSFEVHNPYIHTSDDTMDLISLDHMTNFSKLAIAFAIELASD